MFVSIHLRDGRWTDAFRRTAPKPTNTPGLLHATELSAAPFNGRYISIPQPSRTGFIGVWESDEAIGTWLERQPRRADSWHVRCRPLRALGTWPGLPEDIPRGIAPRTDGPVVGISIGRVRPHRILGFNAHNTRIERQLADSEGLLWATGLFDPPTTLCTVSLWESAAHLGAFARTGAHKAGVEASLAPGYDPSLPDGTRYFAPSLAFMRLQPYRCDGSLSGSNPLPESVFGPLEHMVD